LVCLMVALFRGVFCLFRDNGIRGIGWRSFVKIRNHHYYSMTTNKWYEKGLYFSFSKFPNPVARHEPHDSSRLNHFFVQLGQWRKNARIENAPTTGIILTISSFIYLNVCLHPTWELSHPKSQLRVFSPSSVGMTRNPRLP
jgi:hypothetical protein